MEKSTKFTMAGKLRFSLQVITSNNRKIRMNVVALVNTF